MAFVRRQWPWIVVALVLSAVHLTSVSSEWGGHMGGDNFTYFLLGKAIANGDGYVDLYLPGNPVHRKYPFLFPLLLAPFHLLFDNPLGPMHVMIAFFWVGSFILFGLFVERRRGDRPSAVALALLAGIIPRLYTQSTHLLSEAPFIFFAYAALLLATPPRPAPPTVVKKKHPAPAPAPAAASWNWPRLAGIIVLSLCAYYTRTAALALGAALPVAFWRDRSRVRLGRPVPTWLVFGAVFGLGMAAWWLFANGDRGFAYFGEFMSADPYNVSAGRLSASALALRLLKNVFYFLPLLAMFSIPTLNLGDAVPMLVLASGVVGGLAIFLGLGREFRRGNGAPEVFFLFSLAIAFLWPFQEDRFILPLVPLGLFYFGSTVDWLTIKMQPARRRKLQAAVYAVLFVSAVVPIGKALLVRLQPDPYPLEPVRVAGYGVWNAQVADWSRYDMSFRNGDRLERYILDSMANYIIINNVLARITPADAVILSRKPMITYYYSGRKSVPIRPDKDPRFQWDYIQRQRADYVVEGLGEEDLKPLLGAAPDRFKLVAEINNATKVLKVVNRDQPLPPP